MTSPVSFRLGKKDPVYDSRTLNISNYLYRYSPAPAAHWGHGVQFLMGGNDTYGDCVEVAYLNQQKLWCTHTARAFSLTTDSALAAYTALTGFNPAEPSTDKGTDMLAACKYWAATGMNGLVSAYAAINTYSPPEVMEVISLFGGVYMGFALPLSAQAQTFKTAWTVITGSTGAPGSWGGHCVPCVGYTSQLVYCATWGGIQAMTWEFFHTYADEGYCLLSQDWMNGSRISPAGLSWARLLADKAALSA